MDAVFIPVNASGLTDQVAAAKEEKQRWN